LRVTGSELVGVVPLASMIEAGKYFLRKQQRSVGISDKELIKIANTYENNFLSNDDVILFLGQFYENRDKNIKSIKSVMGKT